MELKAAQIPRYPVPCREALSLALLLIEDLPHQIKKISPLLLMALFITLDSQQQLL